MRDVSTLPVHGEVFLDIRGDNRALRANWHPDAGPDGLLVLSLWRDGVCVGSFRLRPADIAPLVDVLTLGLPREAPEDTRHLRLPGFPPRYEDEYEFDDAAPEPYVTGAQYADEYTGQYADEYTGQYADQYTDQHTEPDDHRRNATG